jgi:hypothetical protein
MRVQRGEQPGAAGAEDQNVSFEFFHKFYSRQGRQERQERQEKQENDLSGCCSKVSGNPIIANPPFSLPLIVRRPRSSNLIYLGDLGGLGG